jgi:hypothetical protein
MAAITPSDATMLSAILLADVATNARHLIGGGTGRVTAAGQRIDIGLSGAHRDTVTQGFYISPGEDVLFAKQAKQALQDHNGFLARVRFMHHGFSPIYSTGE